MSGLGIGAKYFGRVARIINKTNKIKMTTRMRTEIKSLVAESTESIFRSDVADRFADYGRVGVTSIEEIDPVTFLMDTFSMSCRVLGRNAETAFVRELLDENRQFREEFVKGPHGKAAGNNLVEHSFSQHGLANRRIEYNWECSVGLSLGMPHFDDSHLEMRP